MAATITPTVYIIPHDLRAFLLHQSIVFDENSEVPAGFIESLITKTEGDFEKGTGTAFRPRLETEEVQNVRAVTNAYREGPFGGNFVPRRVNLDHRPIMPFDATRGHKIEVYEGDSGTISGTAPEGGWTDYLASKTHGREDDWWTDLQGGVLHLRKTFLFRQYKLLRATYEWGKPITTTSGSTAIDATTITVASTYRYETRGLIRIGNEYIFHTGKTATTFTGCVRAKEGTVASAYDSGSEVYEVPDDIRSLVTMRVAALFLQNEVFTNLLPKGDSASPSFESKVEDWNKQWEKGLSKYQKFTLM